MISYVRPSSLCCVPIINGGCARCPSTEKPGTSGPLPDFDRPGEAPADEAGASRLRPANGMRADPMLRVLDADVRPTDYAETIAAAARRLVLLEDDRERPPWWEAARRSASAETARDGVEAALSRLCNRSAGS